MLKVSHIDAYEFEERKMKQEEKNTTSVSYWILKTHFIWETLYAITKQI